jgi:23S rRNA (adenine2503-C2)-methyltransferase
MPLACLPNRSTNSDIDLLALDPQAMERLVQALGWPRYRATQVLRWLYRSRIRDIRQMTDLSDADRHALARLARIARSERPEVLRSADGTRKIIIRLGDGLLIESVLIPDHDRLTLCLSTQVGCTLDCGFCLTGRMGLKRNLRAHEIVEQVLTVQDLLAPEESLTNLVFMGMGEPLANLDALSEAVRRLSNSVWGVGLSPRRMTVSTSGLASRLKDVAALGLNLAVSLNATTEEQRSRLMPAAHRLHSLKALLTACRRYPLAPRRRLTFEYVLLAGENDTELDAGRLVRLLTGIQCKVNLIPFNEFPGSPYRRPSEGTVLAFQALLQKGGLNVFIRKSKGRDVLGACGQLGEIPDNPARLIPVSGK